MENEEKKRLKRILISVLSVGAVISVFLPMMKPVTSYIVYAETAVILTGVIIMAILIMERKAVVNTA